MWYVIFFRDGFSLTLKKAPNTRIRAILSVKTLKIRHVRKIEQNSFNPERLIKILHLCGSLFQNFVLTEAANN